MSYIPSSISVIPGKRLSGGGLHESSCTAETVPAMFSDNEDDDFTDDESMFSQTSPASSKVRSDSITVASMATDLADKDKQIADLQRALDWATQKTMDLHGDVDSVRSENEQLKVQLRHGEGSNTNLSCHGGGSLARFLDKNNKKNFTYADNNNADNNNINDDGSVGSQNSGFSKNSRRSGTGSILSSFLGNRTFGNQYGGENKNTQRWMEEKEKLEDKLEAAEENYSKTRRALGNCIEEKSQMQRKLKKRAAKLEALDAENEKLRQQQDESLKANEALQEALNESNRQIDQLLHAHDHLQDQLLLVDSHEEKQEELEELLLKQFHQTQMETDDEIRQLKAQLQQSQQEAQQHKQQAQSLSEALHNMEANKEDEMLLLRVAMDHLAGLELECCDEYVGKIKKVMIGIDHHRMM